MESNIGRRIRKSTLVAFILMLTAVECWAGEPTLARLSFWVSHPRRSEFESTFHRQVLPILQKRGLNPAEEQFVPKSDSLFSHTLVFESPSDFLEARRALAEDRGWQDLLQELARELCYREGRRAMGWIRQKAHRQRPQD